MNFERGNNPKSSMGVGTSAYKKIDHITIDIFDERNTIIDQGILMPNHSHRFLKKIQDHRKIDFDVIMEAFPKHAKYIRIDLYKIRTGFNIVTEGDVKTLFKRELYNTTVVYDGKIYDLPEGTSKK